MERPHFALEEGLAVTVGRRIPSKEQLGTTGDNPRKEFNYWLLFADFESFPVFNSLPSATMVPCICTVMTAKPPKAAL